MEASWDNGKRKLPGGGRIGWLVCDGGRAIAGRGWITLVLMDVVNPETLGEGLTEDVQRLGVFEQGLEVGKRIAARPLLPGRVDCGLGKPAQRFEESMG